MLDEAARLGGGRRQRLVDDDGQSGVERPPRERDVRVVRGRDDDEVVLVRMREQLVGVIEYPCPGVLALGALPAAGIAGDDGGDGQPVG